MQAYPLVMAALIIGFERIIELHYGTVGAIGLTTLLIGLKAQNATCMTIGGVALALLVLQSADAGRAATGH